MLNKIQINDSVLAKQINDSAVNTMFDKISLFSFIKLTNMFHKNMFFCFCQGKIAISC